MLKTIFAHLILFTFVSQTALAGFPPTSSRGQSGSKTTTFDFQTPYSQFTKTSGIAGLVETGSFNALANPGFEATTYSTGYTVSGGTLAAAATTDIFFSKGATWDSSAAGQTFTSTAVTIPEGFKGQNCEASFYLKTASGTSTHLIQAFDGTNVIATQAVISSALFAMNRVVFPCPTSGTFALRLLSVAANEPLIATDEGYLGLARNIGSTQLITEPVAYTPVFTGFGTVTAIEVTSHREGAFLVLNGKFTPGTVTAVEARMTIGFNGVSGSVTSTAIPSIRIAGHATFGLASAVSPEILIEPSVNYVTFGQQGTSNAGLTKLNGTPLGTTISFTNVLIPIVGWTAQTLVMPDAQGVSFSGLHGGDCSWTTASTSFASPSADASCTFTQRTNRNFGTVTTEGASLPGIVFTPRVTGRYFVCATTAAYTSLASGYVATQLRNVTTSTNIASTGRRMAGSGGTNDEVPLPTCGIVDIPSIVATTITLQMLTTSGTATVNNLSGSTSIEWSIFALDQPMSAILANSVSTANTNGERSERATINISAAAACSVTSQSGTWITNASASGTVCTLTVTGFSGLPSCSFTRDSSSAAIIGTVAVNSATSVAAALWNTSAVIQTGSAHILCMGPR